MSAAALVAALGSLVFAASDGLAAASLGRLLVGLGSGFSWIGTVVLATYYFPPHRFALLIGIGQLIGMAGAVFGQAPLAAAVGLWGWCHTTLAIGALGLAIAGGLFIAARDRGDASHQTAGSLVAGLRQVGTNGQTWLFAYLGMAFAVPLLAFGGLWAVPFFTTAYDMDRGGAAALASLLFIGWGIGAPILGWLSDRRGRRKGIIIVCAAAVTVQLLAAFYIPNLPLAVLGGLLLGTGFVGSAMGLTFAGGRACNPAKNAGVALGIINTAVMAGGAAFQPLIGLLLDAAWDGSMRAGARLYGAADYRLALIVLPLVSGLAVLIAMVVKETPVPPPS